MIWSEDLNLLIYIYIYIYIERERERERERKFIYTSIYIYIFTNLISTSIHGTRKKEKKTRQEQGIKISWITARGKRKNIIGQKERKGQPRHTSGKKIKRYAVSWSKENWNLPWTLQCYNYKSAQHEWSQLFVSFVM